MSTQAQAAEYMRGLQSPFASTGVKYVKHNTKDVTYEVLLTEYYGYKNANWYVVHTHTEAFGDTTIRVPMEEFSPTDKAPLAVKF